MVFVRFMFLFLLTVNLNTSSAQDTTSIEEAYHLNPIEVMPSFPHGKDSLMNFIYSHLKWPDPMFCGEGFVVLQIEVNEVGAPTTYTILKGIAPIADNEALRVAKLIKEWKPAIRGGRPICSHFNLPVKFKLH